MTKEYLQSLNAPRRRAVTELIEMIKDRYPTATFMVGPGEDAPGATHITATVDVDDPDAVTDLVIDREIELQVDESIPVYVIPIRTPERAAAVGRKDKDRRATQSAVLFPPARPAEQRLLPSRYTEGS